MRIAIPLTVLATALVCLLTSAPAHARARVFVASYGNDANSCTFGSPCKTFQHAHDAVDAGGEVSAIDSAGFGPIIITKSVTITSPQGVEAGVVPASGGDAIVINPSLSSTVTLRGLTLEGSGGGLNGIALFSSMPGTLNIIGCVIKDFSGTGISITPSNSGSFGLVITDSYVLNNAANGIEINPQTSNTTVMFGIEKTNVNGNGTSGDNAGLLFNGSSGFFRGGLSSVNIQLNNIGINFIGGNLAQETLIANSNILFNLSGDITNNGAASNVWLLNSNQITTVLNNAGAVASDGTNDILSVSGNSLSPFTRR